MTHEAIPAVETEPATIEELKSEPIVAETPEQKEVPIAEAIPAPAPETLTSVPALPKTASPVPLIALLGMLSISFAFMLKRCLLADHHERERNSNAPRAGVTGLARGARRFYCESCDVIPRTSVLRLRHFSRGCALYAAAAYRARLQSAQANSAGQGTISVETELVVLPVRVTGPGGDFVSGLAQEQFRVYEDGRWQPITLFRQEDTPVTVGLVVDHSRSMGPKLSGVAAAVSAFAQSSNPEDEMFVVDFSDNVSVELPGGKPFTSNPQELAQAVSAVSARGMTALYDAVAEGLNHLQLGQWDRKALIIVSDGGDDASGRKYADVLKLSRQSQAVIYAIGLVGAPEEENPGVLRQLSKDTGGLAFFPAQGESISGVSSRIAHDLREQYTLGFMPERRNGDSFQKIHVEVTAPGLGKLQVRTRSGYFAAPLQRPVAGAGKGQP